MTHVTDLHLLIGGKPVIVIPGLNVREEFIRDVIIPGFMTIGTDRQSVPNICLCRMFGGQLIYGCTGCQDHDQQQKKYSRF